MTKTAAINESTIFRNAFIGQAKEPTPRELAEALGTAKALWDQLVDELAGEHKLTTEWKSHSIKAGWSLRLKRETRNIVYLSPSRGSFMASFALGGKAIQVARASELAKRVLKRIAEAKKYAEGTAVRIEVKESEDIAVVKKLAQVKLET